MRTTLLSLCLAGGLVASTPAVAQPASGNGIGVRGLATFGVSQMTAADSFETVLGSASLRDFGGGAQVTNLWRGLFVEATIGRSRETGGRVFVHDGRTFPLGIPLTMTITTVDVTTGYRFNRGGRVVPYAGGGVTSAGYRHRSRRLETTLTSASAVWS